MGTMIYPPERITSENKHKAFFARHFAGQRVKQQAKKEESCTKEKMEDRMNMFEQKISELEDEVRRLHFLFGEN